MAGRSVAGRNSGGQFTGARGAGVDWSDEVTKALQEFGPKAERAIDGVLEYNATQAQSYARSNAPWTDRTTNARNGLFAKALRDHTLQVYHTMPYGKWLELRWNGKYAIIQRTLQAQGPQVMRMMAKLTDRMRSMR